MREAEIEIAKQASLVAAAYLSEAVHYIDEQLGKGYASARPELLAAFINCAVVVAPTIPVRRKSSNIPPERREAIVIGGGIDAIIDMKLNDENLEPLDGKKR